MFQCIVIRSPKRNMRASLWGDSIHDGQSLSSGGADGGVIIIIIKREI